GAAAAVGLAGTERTGPRAVRLVVLALAVIGALLLVMPTGLTVTAFVLVGPVVGLLVLGMERGASDADALPRLGALAAGFVVVAVLAYAGTLATIGPARFVREALLVGAGVAELYAVPLPWTAGLAALVGLVAFALRGSYARALFLA